MKMRPNDNRTQNILVNTMHMFLLTPSPFTGRCLGPPCLGLVDIEEHEKSEAIGGELLDFHETEEKPLAFFYLIVFQDKIV